MLLFAGPNSFTGENTVERHIHGPLSIMYSYINLIYIFGPLVVLPVSGLVTPQVLWLAGPNSFTGKDPRRATFERC